MKFLIWLAIGCLIVAWLMRGNRHRQPERRTMGDEAQAAGAVTVEAMLACAHCGLHFPASEALTNTNGSVFCSIEHQRLHGLS